MDMMIVIGIIAVAAGVVLFAVSQLLLRQWIKKYNKEWQGGIDQNDLP